MKVRGFKRIVAGVAAASALALGAGVIAPGVAMADDPVDPEVEIPEGGLLPPVLDVSQDGYAVTVEITNPNAANWGVDGSACTPVLISGPGLIDSGMLFLQKEYLALAEKALTPGQNDFKIGLPAVNVVAGQTNSVETTWTDLSPNFYLLTGFCMALGEVSFNAEPVIVPGGIGDFGSLEALNGISSGLGG